MNIKHLLVRFRDLDDKIGVHREAIDRYRMLMEQTTSRLCNHRYRLRRAEENYYYGGDPPLCPIEESLARLKVVMESEVRIMNYYVNEFREVCEEINKAIDDELASINRRQRRPRWIEALRRMFWD